jgi:hypothetical protein
MRARHSSLTSGRSRAAVAAAALFASLASTEAAAQSKVTGFADCQKCHKQAINKWKTEEPAQLGGKAHFNTLKQLSDPKAATYAAAIGLASATAPTGRCVECHATVVRGTPRTGVSCETCHGPASAWIAVHDKEPFAESYKKSLPLGLRDLHLKPAAIAAMCVDCHVTPEKVLAAAGHPNGAKFDAGESLKKLVHWTSAFTGDGSEHAKYDYAQVSASSRPLVAKRLAAAGSAATAKAAPPAAAKPAAAASTPAGTAPAPATPPSAPASAPARAPRASPPSRAAAPAASASPPPPWDWDQPVAPLPDDYPSDPEPEAEPAPAAVAPVAQPVPAAPNVPPAPAPPPPAIPRKPRPAPASIAEDQPLPPDAGAALAPPPPPPQAEPAARPRNKAAEAAELRSKGADLLVRLLANGRRAPSLAAPAKPAEYKGPDSELLHLQDVVLYLALETLRRQEQ